MNRSETLKTADNLVNGDRATEYGHPSKNFAAIAKMWSVILKQEISLAQVAMCLIALKMSRLINNETHPDSWVDICGYSACGSEITSENKNG